MTFNEWCLNKFGIAVITEGKVVSLRLLPIAKNPFLTNFHQILIGSYGAVAEYKQGQFIGYSLPKSACDTFAHNMHLASHGFHLHEVEYNFQAPVLFKVTGSKQANFLAQFKDYNPVRQFDPLSKEERIRLNPKVLEDLYYNYYIDQPVKKSVAQLKSELAEFQVMQQQIMSNNLSDYLNKAHALSLDYTNSRQVNCALYQASSAYAMSLRTFAELHKASFSEQQYATLMHAIEMLASYDGANNLRQGLKSDSSFIDHITGRLVQNKVKSDGSFKLIRELPNGNYIKQLIHQNTQDLLHGQKHASLGKNKTFTMRRFLPNSTHTDLLETNEIVLQTGGMRTHSSMVRLIKVGMLNNGTQAPQGVKPHYFNYFKVETNLGAGCHNAEWRYKTCTGTYITQLYPTLINAQGNIVKSAVNPLQNPIEYQQQMEHTLTELIKTERELCFYRQPQSGPNGEGASPPHSAEAREWLRLNAKLDALNGIPVLQPVTFLSINANGEEVPAWVENQTGYMQEGGSCPIFSIKQLVTSVIGNELSALHSQFLQTHNGARHLQVIANEITERENQLELAYKETEHLVKAYVDSINAYSLILQNPQTLYRNTHRLTLHVHASLGEWVKDFPHLQQVCIESTGHLFEEFAETMLHEVKNSQQNNLIFHHLKKAYASIPAEFRDPYKEQLEKMHELHQHRELLYKILDSDDYTHAEYSFLSQSLKNSKGRVSLGIINDIKTIRQFCNNKLQLAEQNNFDGTYKKSINEFYKQAVAIRLSDLSHEDQAQQMKNIAHTEFSHRHGVLRILADIITMIGTLFGIGIGRVLTGHTFFWSTAPTTRESEITAMLQPQKDADTVFSPILMAQG